MNSLKNEVRKMKNFKRIENRLLETARIQEGYLLKIRDRIIARYDNPNENTNFIYERSVLIGMISMLDALKIDRKEFNWIF
jgi:hypothetical protein